MVLSNRGRDCVLTGDWRRWRDLFWIARSQPVLPGRRREKELGVCHRSSDYFLALHRQKRGSVYHVGGWIFLCLNRGGPPEMAAQDGGHHRILTGDRPGRDYFRRSQRKNMGDRAGGEKEMARPWATAHYGNATGLGGQFGVLCITRRVFI